MTPQRSSGFKKQRSPIFIALLTLASLLFGVLSVSAQTPPQPISIGENKTGSLTQAAPTSSFALLVDAPQTLNIRVFAISPGLAPTVSLYDSAGNIIALAQNNGTQTAVQIAGTEVPFGVYRIDVSTANGQFGDFFVNVQAEEQVPPVPLPLGQSVNGAVSSTGTRLRYSFSTPANEGRWLFVQSLLVGSGPVVELFDQADPGEPLASVGARLRNVRLGIPPGAANYLVEVSYGGAATNEAFLICLAPENNPNACPITGNQPQVIPTDIPAPTLPPTQLPPLPPSNVCILGSATGGNVNVRSGPSTNFSVVTQLNASTIANVIGRLPDNSWYQIQVAGLTGWISATVTRLGGPCNLVPVVIPTATPTPPATATPTTTGGFTATPTATATATATATVTIPPAATLNFSLPPVYGSTSLTSGFVPDPFQVGVTAGGPANPNYLGGGCAGFMTSAPSFSVNYTSGAFPTLRFYFIGSGDTTMVINGPSGSYFCNDDSFGTLNPTIDFNSPSSGRYDVWIGTFSSGAAVGGTLFVTENTGNHP